MKKRFLGGFLSIFVLAAALLSGCGNSSESSGSSESVGTDTEVSAAVSEESSETADSAEEDVDDQLADIQEAGKIVVGIEGTYPPFTYHDDDGDLQGFDVELANAIGEKLGVEVEFVEAAWDSLLAGVDSGRLDTVINDVSVTDEREEKYDFSTPYLYIPQQVVVRSDNDEITSLEDLDGKLVATNITNAYAEQLESYGATIVGIDTSDEAATLVLSGRADFCMFSPIILNDYLSEHEDAELKVAFKIEGSQEVIAIPVRKGETRFLEAINEALEELSSDGTLLELSEKYFGGDYTAE